MLASTSGWLAPFWIPVLLLPYERGELKPATVAATVAVGAIAAVFGMLVPGGVAAVLGSGLVILPLAAASPRASGPLEPEKVPETHQEPEPCPPEPQPLSVSVVY